MTDTDGMPSVIPAEAMLLLKLSVSAVVVRLAELETGGAPRLFTIVTICMVTTSDTPRLLLKVITTLYGAVPVPIGGVTVVVNVLDPTVLLIFTAVTSNMAGRLSVTTTLGAGIFPRFRTVIVNVTTSPTAASVGLAAFAIAGSTKPGAGA
jgi:hypothetical protein